MAMNFNGVEVSSVSFDDSEINRINLNGETVWNKISDPLEITHSWAALDAMTSSQFKNTCQVGMYKKVRLATGDTVKMILIGFDHDTRIADGQAKATFMVEGVLDTNYPITNGLGEGKWSSSVMKQDTLRALFEELPNEVQDVIKVVSKQMWSSTVTADKLFLLSLAEVFSETAIVNSGWDEISDNATQYLKEGHQYEYWKNTVGDRDPVADNACPALIKRDSKGNAVSWWLRSQDYDWQYAYWCFGSNGVVDGAFGNTLRGVSFCFCI